MIKSFKDFINEGEIGRDLNEKLADLPKELQHEYDFKKDVIKAEKALGSALAQIEKNLLKQATEDVLKGEKPYGKTVDFIKNVSDALKEYTYMVKTISYVTNKEYSGAFKDSDIKRFNREILDNAQKIIDYCK